MGEWKRSEWASGKGALQAEFGRWTGDLEKQWDSQLAMVCTWCAGCVLPAAEPGAAGRSPSQLARGARGLQKWLLSLWLPRLSERPRNEVQFPLACLVLDLLPLVKRGREY